jgi:hypothetical protein
LSAHRRPTLRDEATPRRRPSPAPGKRRNRSKPYRLLPVALGFALLGFGVAAGPSVVGGGWSSGGGGQSNERITFAALPKDAPDQGLVYEGLKTADGGSLCAGSYELDPQTCTHGPDTAPAGLRVRRDVAPITAKAPEPDAPGREGTQVPSDAEIVRDEGGSALSAGAPALIPDAAPGEADFVMGTHGVACEGDGRTGKRVQVLYLHEFGTPSRYTDFLGSIRTWSAQVDAIFDASAGETGGSRHIRFVTTPQCRVDVAEVQVPETALDSFTSNIDALATLGYNRTDRKYLIFADTNVYCGIGSYIGDKRAGLGNRNNGGPAYGRVDAGCWSSVMAAHELTHSLGAVLQGSPNSSGGGSCTDDYDLLCGKDRSNAAVRTICPRKHENRLDCGHDDYFSTNPRPNSYLAKNWNVAQSEFLLRSDGGDDIPDAGSAALPAAGGGKPADATATTPPPAAPDAPAPTEAAPDPQITSGGSADGGGDAPPAPEVTETAPAEGGEAADTEKVAYRGPRAKAPVEAVEKVQAVLDQQRGTADLERRRPEGDVRGGRRRCQDRDDRGHPRAAHRPAAGLQVPGDGAQRGTRLPGQEHGADRARGPARAEFLVRADELADRRSGRPVRGPHRPGHRADPQRRGGRRPTAVEAGPGQRRYVLAAVQGHRQVRRAARRQPGAGNPAGAGRLRLHGQSTVVAAGLRLRIHAAYRRRRPGRRRGRAAVRRPPPAGAAGGERVTSPELDGRARVTGAGQSPTGRGARPVGIHKPGGRPGEGGS